MNQSRWKSPVLWSAAVAQIVSLLILLKVIDTGMGDMVNQVAAGVLQLLTLFGVVNNPTSSESL
mgnify:CR=1 FL=1